MAFIYKITNKVNGKIYVGRTVNSLKIRFSAHLSDSSGCPRLRNSIQKHGRDNFIIESILECDESQCDLMEMFYINFLKSHVEGIGYNLTHKDTQGWVRVPCRYVPVVVNGIEFSCMDEAARSLGINKGTLTKRKKSGTLHMTDSERGDFFKAKRAEKTRLCKERNLKAKRARGVQTKSESKKGSNNPSYGKPATHRHIPIIAEGLEFDFISQASKMLGIDRRVIAKRAKSKNFPNYSYV